MSLIQLDPPLVLNTPKGKAVCHFLLDYGFKHDLYWICFQHETGECWTWNNKDIRIDNNGIIILDGPDPKDYVSGIGD